MLVTIMSEKNWAEKAASAHETRARVPDKGPTHERDTEQERDCDHEREAGPVPVLEGLF